MNNIATIEYKDSLFEIDPNKKMVNLTKIAKHFSKEVKHWNELLSTKNYLQTLEEITGKARSELLTSVKGGNLQGVEH